MGGGKVTGINMLKEKEFELKGRLNYRPCKKCAL